MFHYVNLYKVQRCFESRNSSILTIWYSLALYHSMFQLAFQKVYIGIYSKAVAKVEF